MVRGAVIAVLVGAAIAMQVRLHGRVTADAGPQIVGLLVSSAGVAVALVAVAVVRDWAAVGRVVTRPDWGIAGALGVIAVAGLGAASARAGTVVTVAGSIAGQLVTSAVLDRVWSVSGDCLGSGRSRRSRGQPSCASAASPPPDCGICGSAANPPAPRAPGPPHDAPQLGHGHLQPAPQRDGRADGARPLHHPQRQRRDAS